MSRICIKGLSKATTEVQLRSHFAVKGEITDCRIMKTKDGKSRQFGFIGFKSEAQARDAMDYFNNTYLNTSKIHVELAAKLDDNLSNIENLRSKHTKKKLEFIKSKLAAEESINEHTDQPQVDLDKEESKSKSKTKKAIQMEEFLQVMTSRGQAKVWGNDEKEMTEHSINIHPIEADVEIHSNDDSTDAKPDMSNLPEASDMGFLKSKVATDFSDSDSDGKKPIKLTKKISKKVSVEENKSGLDESSSGIKKDEIDDTGRLFVRNLPFSATEDDLKQIFEPVGTITEVHMPLDSSKRGKGFAFVHFLFPEHAQKALKEIDGISFQGRLLHILPSKVPIENQSVSSSQNHRHLSTFQQKKEEERRKQVNKKDGWNASHVRTDTVIESLAERYGIKVSDIVDTSEGAGEMAVRVALAETQVIQENREYFTSHGVNIAALESTNSKEKASSRSTTTILVKNLPHDMIVDELKSMFSKFGDVDAFLVPKSRSMALVDFVEPSEARQAYKSLAYRSYHKMPLYLEWAPLNIIDKSKASATREMNPPLTDEHGEEMDEQDDNHDEYSTLFIKNLNFLTTEEKLLQYVKKLGIQGLRMLSIQRRGSGEEARSMGFGFAEFRNHSLASDAMKRLNKIVIDDHAIEVKPSEKRLSSAPTSSSTAKAPLGVNKLVVRNVPFQATTAEIRSLFSSYSSVKSVRIPKKMDGNHRGFAFVEFPTAQEAANAMKQLSSTHLYGRHLVIEWANVDNVDDVNLLRKRAKDQQKVLKNDMKRRRLNDDEDGQGGGALVVDIKSSKNNGFEDEDDDDDYDVN